MLVDSEKTPDNLVMSQVVGLFTVMVVKDSQNYESMSTTCDITALFGIFLDPNKHQTLMRLRCVVSYTHSNQAELTGP